MHRQPLIHLLDHYETDYPEELNLVAEYRDFVTGTVDCFERSQLSGHVTGSAWLLNVDATRVLLTHHKKLNRWLQPGGHADGVTDVARVAMKEALEESGLNEIRFYVPQLLDVDIHQIPGRKDEPAHYHYDCRFLLQAVGSDQFTISDESNELSWVLLDEVSNYTDEVSIARMLDKSKSLVSIPFLIPNL